MGLMPPLSSVQLPCSLMHTMGSHCKRVQRESHMLCQTCVSVYLPKSTLVPWGVLIICLNITRGRTLHMQQYLDLLIDALLDEGFTVEEANRLIQLREEYEEQLATEETNYHRFIRWLVDHGRLSDW
jgi:hypothetical protein